MVTTEEPAPTNGHADGGLTTRRRLRRRRPVAPVGPAARFEPGRVAETRHRNPGWLLGGVLLVVVSALGGVLLFSSRGDRQEALVASRDLEAGDLLAPTDLRVERVAFDGRVGTVDASALGLLVGQRVVGPVPQGALVHPGMFAPDSPLGLDEMEIGAALDPGEFPRSEIPTGAPVELLVTSSSDVPPGPAAQTPGPGATASDEAASPATRGASSIGTGTVTGVEERATGQVLLTVRVTRDIGLLVAQANRDDTLRVALTGAQE